MKRWACDRGGDEQGKMRSILEVKGFEGVMLFLCPFPFLFLSEQLIQRFGDSRIVLDKSPVISKKSQSLLQLANSGWRYNVHHLVYFVGVYQNSVSIHSVSKNLDFRIAEFALFQV